MFTRQHNFFTLNRGIPNVQYFLTKRVPEYEAYLKKIYSEVFDNEYENLKKNL